MDIPQDWYAYAATQPGEPLMVFAVSTTASNERQRRVMRYPYYRFEEGAYVQIKTTMQSLDPIVHVESVIKLVRLALDASTIETENEADRLSLLETVRLTILCAIECLAPTIPAVVPGLRALHEECDGAATQLLRFTAIKHMDTDPNVPLNLVSGVDQLQRINVEFMALLRSAESWFETATHNLPTGAEFPHVFELEPIPIPLGLAADAEQQHL